MKSHIDAQLISTHLLLPHETQHHQQQQQQNNTKHIILYLK